MFPGSDTSTWHFVPRGKNTWKNSTCCHSQGPLETLFLLSLLFWAVHNWRWWSPKEAHYTGNTSKMRLNYNLWLPIEHFGLLLYKNQQVRKRVIILILLINPDQQEKVGICYSMEEENNMCVTQWSFRYLLVIPCIIVIANGQVQHPLPAKDMIIRDSDISGMRVWVITS